MLQYASRSNVQRLRYTDVCACSWWAETEGKWDEGWSGNGELWRGRRLRWPSVFTAALLRRPQRRPTKDLCQRQIVRSTLWLISYTVCYIYYLLHSVLIVLATKCRCNYPLHLSYVATLPEIHWQLHCLPLTAQFFLKWPTFKHQWLT